MESSLAAGRGYAHPAHRFEGRAAIAWFPIGFIIFWYVLLLFFPIKIGGIQAYEDFVLKAYLWLLLGSLFRLPQIKVSAELALLDEASTAAATLDRLSCA